MTEHIIVIAFLFFATLFTGIVLFLSSVLRRTFNMLRTEDYHRVYTTIIGMGRRSLLINAIVLVPIAAFLVYLFAGYGHLFFIVGAVVYILGSFLGSRFINEPLYAILLRADPGNSEELASLRMKLNRGNIVRALLSCVGVVFVSLSLFL